jgi:hypothetical protein
MLRLKDAQAHMELQKRVDARFKTTEKMPWIPVRAVVDAAMRAPPADEPPVRTMNAFTGNSGGVGGECAVPVLTDAVVRNKYGNRKTGSYASVKEAKRAFELQLMQQGKQIRNLKEKTRFLLIPAQYTKPPKAYRIAEHACNYECDFEYEEWTATGWQRVVEDCKGVLTKEYRIKRKLMLFVHGIKVRET